MARAKPGRQKNQRNSRVQRAHNRGVYAVRRTISEESFDIFERVAENLTAEFRGVDRLFTPQTLTVTVVGFRRFSQRLKDRGPTSRSVSRSVPTSNEVIEAKLGLLDVFGSGNAHKLAFKLQSSDLSQEISDYEETYREAGYKLIPDFNSPEGSVPHCSIASLHKSNIDHHRDSSVLKRYNNLASALGATVLLAPCKQT